MKTQDIIAILILVILILFIITICQDIKIHNLKIKFYTTFPLDSFVIEDFNETNFGYSCYPIPGVKGVWDCYFINLNKNTKFLSPEAGDYLYHYICYEDSGGKIQKICFRIDKYIASRENRKVDPTAFISIKNDSQ